jgi:hypothetical protein
MKALRCTEVAFAMGTYFRKRRLVCKQLFIKILKDIEMFHLITDDCRIDIKPKNLEKYD